MTFKGIDISDWSVVDREIRYRQSDQLTVPGELIGNFLRPTGDARLLLKSDIQGVWMSPSTEYGTDVRQWHFLKPRPEIEKLIQLAKGELKLGAPLPAKAKDDEAPFNDVDPVGNRPAEPARQTAVKDSRLRRVAGKATSKATSV